MIAAIQQVTSARQPAWRCWTVAALLAALLALSPAAAAAQTAAGTAAGSGESTKPAPAPQLPATQAPGTMPAGGAGMTKAGAMSPMSEEGLRRLPPLLLSLHGFERTELDALGGDVAVALKGLVTDEGDDPLLRRQAIKALGLYPTDDTLAFLSARLGAPEPREKRLVLTVLSAFAASKPQEVRQIVQAHLTDPNVTVRYAALSLSSHLPRTPETWNLLRARLPQEQDAGLRRAIESRLPDLKPAN